MDEKDAETEKLKAKLEKLRNPGWGPPAREACLTASAQLDGRSTAPTRVGKALPVDPYTGEDIEVWWEDWLPTFERAASWNKWTDGEKVIQLAGHLKKRALMEWNSIEEADRNNYTTACKSMQTRMDPGCKAIAAQDFRHTVQKDTEPVMDFILRLERIFQRA